MHEVLVIEDEPAIMESVVYALKKAGFAAEGVDSLFEARERLHERDTSLHQSFDLVILDLMLPDGSGFDLLDSLRGEAVVPAVIVLSSRDSEIDRVRALEGGADDYVTKPFSPREVVARVRAVLRRGMRQSESHARSGALRVELKSRRVFIGEQSVELTKVEFELLALFAADAGNAFPRVDIIDAIWGDGFALSDRTIDSHIKALRRKLAEAGGNADWIETVRGIGYRLSNKACLGEA